MPRVHPDQPGSGTANLSSTAQTVLALSAANVDLAGANGLSYLEATLTPTSPTGADGPGKLAILILDADALGESAQLRRQ